MSRTRRKFSPEERLSILQEGDREGQSATCRKYNLSPSLYARWRLKYLQQGMQGLHPAYRRVDPQVRELELENARLKKIIAMQALEIEVKSELLKKTPIQPRKR